MTDAAAGAEDEGIGVAALAPLGSAAIAAVAVAVLFLDTSVSMVEAWHRSDTFTHGFFVVPIFLWLVWRERETVASLPATLDTRSIPLLIGAGALWLISRVADLLAGQQIALALMIVFVIRACVGPAIARALRSPLLFLLFLVPLGEELIPFLMEVTADLTVAMVDLTGIPIYRDGLFFSLPSGDWSVVEACSGISYLIASIMLGSLYAHLYIGGAGRKLSFIALAAVVPIVANGVRAFMIVMIGHFSNMTLAKGFDHLVYGWLFFGVVMFLLFSVGSLFHRGEPRSLGDIHTNASPERTEGRTTGPKARQGVAVRAMSIAACVLLWPLWAHTIESRADGIVASASDKAHLLPTGPESSEDIDASVMAWRPRIAGHDDLRVAVLDIGLDRPPVLALAYVYVRQHQGKEMIASANVLVRSRDSDWRQVERRTVMSPPAREAASMPIEQARLESSDASLLVRRWYRVGDTHTGRAAVAKLLETRDQLLLRTVPSVAYVLAVDAADTDVAEAALDEALVRIRRTEGTMLAGAPAVSDPTVEP